MPRKVEWNPPQHGDDHGRNDLDTDPEQDTQILLNHCFGFINRKTSEYSYPRVLSQFKYEHGNGVGIGVYDSAAEYIPYPSIRR